MSTARSITLYIEPKTLKRLRLALEIYPQSPKTEVLGIEMRKVTADELGDRLINEKIDETYPLVKGLEKALTKTQQEYIEEHKQ